MSIKKLITFLYIITSIPLFLFFRENIFIWLSFFINYLLITYIAYYHINKEEAYSPFLSSYIVFNFLFFIAAPIVQITSMGQKSEVFINGFPYNQWSIIHANFLILLFNLFFFTSYITFKKRYLKQNKTAKQSSFLTPLLIFSLLVLSIVIVGANFSYIQDEILISIYEKNKESVFSVLARKKVLFMVPLGAIALTYKYLRLKNKLTTNTFLSFIIIIVLLFLLLVLKNPLIEKRNALGPIYITLIYLFYPKSINSNAKSFLFLFFSMIIAFPIVSSLTHIDYSLSEIIVNPKLMVERFISVGGITNAFNSLNYDAFANVMATVEYVDENGFSFGYQLLSALLFFIPRSIWASKPTSTGEVVGQYLVDYHDFGDGKFNNLSNPMVSEGYINFGLIGVILIAICLSYFIVRFIKWLNSEDPLKEIIAFYFAIHLIFFLRGDFTNGFVYFIGTLIGVLIVPKITHSVLKAVFKKRNEL